MSRAFLTLASIAAAACVQTAVQKPVHNDSKRKFYENEQQVVPLPGTVTPSSPAETEVLGPRTLVNGVTVRTFSPLESALRSVRQTVFCAYQASFSYLNDKKHVVLEHERRVTGTVAALHSRHEDLLPNGVYIAIAGLLGNIMARNKNIVARAVYPAVLGVAAFGYFLPQTFRNTFDFLWRAEQRVLPQVAQQQVAAYEQAHGLVGRVEETAVSGQRKVHDGLENLRHTVLRVTGLNIDEEVLKK
ncbi:hypothetical protein METBIDRAFT_34678 [Metschnikowia bicuspidata var. bicuspidata NRRL YB-4993]|uniref:MICOS complex subunit n=1 Tax=Metschnikowia bicuspidata var. bicuspidata NRRL YB-4993 TaxID=869754 RepID=A0A1A0HJP4_9ASCO|nr:hypothetical protein METBIDRAFT_34678 [Metschnikowia bicuspidata var. bicuspidata NRRL YB-4993]OBA24038.1 hypothetical protein METBIDRAFT_34678 [Metschnikowia bicuspidata var. bicuspidata NRRL YB-4993]